MIRVMSAECDPTADRRDVGLCLQTTLSPDSNVKSDVNLGRRTTFKVGGDCDWFVEIGSETDLIATLKVCRNFDLPVLVLGRGSNLLVRDGGFRGVVISLQTEAFSAIEVDGPCLRCGAGARLKKVAATAKDQAVAGFEFLEGIPGSIGGALRMNAGAMGWEIFDFVRSVRIADLSGTINQWAKEDLHYRYRSCSDLKNGVALSVVLEGASGDRNAIAQRMNEGSKKRWSSQPAAMSAGCVFRNPDEIPAGKLVDELGLKGMAIGDARVSTIHGNFIVNEGKATAKDILALIEKVKEEALNRRGVELKVEVKIVGSDE